LSSNAPQFKYCYWQAAGYLLSKRKDIPVEHLKKSLAGEDQLQKRKEQNKQYGNFTTLSARKYFQDNKNESQKLRSTKK
jgi:glutaredoxin 2